MYFMFAVEFFSWNAFSLTMKPDILLIALVFIQLYAGIRYGLYAAVLAGLIRDCMVVSFFGEHVAAYMVAMYAAAWLQQNYYEKGSNVWRMILVLAAYASYACVLLLSGTITTHVSVWTIISAVMIPELILTVLFGPWVIQTIGRWVILFDG